MTKDEIGDIVVTIPQGLGANEFIYHLVNRAVELEREACAKVVESDGLARGEYGYMLTKAAARIRARSEK